ncbi:MAG: class I SAM-dependent methyltransferase [Acetatifactor sp.]|nr:class I SAM-dependent methyltransferase [Acetatifactor sp.]
MRNITKYEDDYLQEDFEIYQVEYRRKKILECIDDICPDAILEIGCGMHPLFEFIPEESYKEYTLIEPGDQFYANAVKLGTDSKKIHIIHDFFGKDAIERVQEHYLQQINKIGGGTRLIVCAGLLHEVENPDELLEAIGTISDENTVVLLNVPNANSFHRVLAQRMNIIKSTFEMTERNLIFQQNRVYDLRSFSDIIERNGFQILKRETAFVKPFTHAQMLSMLKNNIIDTQVLEGLYAMSADFPEYGSEIFVECVKTQSVGERKKHEGYHSWSGNCNKKNY